MRAPMRFSAASFVVVGLSRVRHCASRVGSIVAASSAMPDSGESGHNKGHVQVRSRARYSVSI